MKRGSHKRNFFSKHGWLLYGASPITVQRAYKIQFSTRTAPSEKVIKRCVKKFYATGNISPLKQSGRPKTARTPQNIRLVKDVVEANPKASV